MRILFDADRLESDSLHPRSTARCDEYPVAPQLVAAVEFEDVVVFVTPGLGDTGGEHELNAFTLQHRAERLTEWCSLPAEHMCGHVGNDHLAAQSAHDLTHLHPDGSAPNISRRRGTDFIDVA